MIKVNHLMESGFIFKNLYNNSFYFLFSRNNKNVKGNYNNNYKVFKDFKEKIIYNKTKKIKTIKDFIKNKSRIIQMNIVK